ncbi:hypothetical protein ROZALSC1DRAFT_28777 [Rozella allomycis CSF55]|uniref:Inhibitor of growth protein N-terminal histone-binding domain-containing protein n=1 Tax=Rozella allomycis (strain CSF55) TaxID=988480 RepID=A0A075ARV1_ROZAC|nr:hypothetical protein O9G_002823 [Rozella allomycis CSF55]RKP19650.1 hypothetical protein ROZALSC1DRAFT_28777 [Rozella allomycis CSF55]|eukprot:EPZ32905.1 hypothetical protein O9G_002823 [Rozella allomycis CSF55]
MSNSLCFEDIIDNIETLPLEFVTLLQEMREEELRLQSLRLDIFANKKALMKQKHLNPDYSIIDVDSDDDEFFLIRNMPRDKVDAENESRLSRIREDFIKANDCISTKITLGEKLKSLIRKYAQQLDHDIENFEVVVNEHEKIFEPRKFTFSEENKENVSNINESNQEASVNQTTTDETLYCFCRQLCKYNWFHYVCVGLSTPPKGSWYCSECMARRFQ